ncbi:MAG: hypothetical protein RDU83_13870 [bacterium]|nr:hypothetical protein [bacterium]
MTTGKGRAVQATTRALIQAAKHAVRDIYDAVVELVTNADDRYQILDSDGVIEIELERRRGTGQSVIRVRDFADGMDAATMERKLSFVGGRDSGLDSGELVRGTHSRGAKDVAALGRVLFESIAADGKYHSCEITPFFDFISHDTQEATPEVREALGIPKGTGTLVTIELDGTQRVPQHDKLNEQTRQLVSLRGILPDKRRKVVLRDLNHGREDVLHALHIEGTERLKETLQIPGYSGVTAKLIVCRARERFDKEHQRFRLGGILIESRRAIHEATLFDSGLESNPHALWFYGRLVCPYIDDLCNRFDDRFERKLPPEDDNPTYPTDPSRRSGLAREHPFTQALFGEALKRLRPLVEEERVREEHERARIESQATRKRLDALEKAALEFMRDFGEDEDVARDPEGSHPDSSFMERGYLLSPPFTQVVVGHSRQFWLTVRLETFPELEVGSTVQIQCLSPEVTADKTYCGLEPHPSREGVLQATWKVKALNPTPATGIRVRVGSITDESIIEVLASEADKYSHVKSLQFGKKRYSMRTDQKRKAVRVFAPLELVSIPTSFDVAVDSRHFKVTGQAVLVPRDDLGVAICELGLKCDGREASGSLTATLGRHLAVAHISAHVPMGADLSIRLEDIDLTNQRYRWRQNVLEVAARHPSLKRYLGSKDQKFPGQETKHFRVLLAEVVADAVCARLVSRNVQANPEEYEDADWDHYYAQYSKYMTQFLPTAHKSQYSEP